MAFQSDLIQVGKILNSILAFFDLDSEFNIIHLIFIELLGFVV